jgi:hypothetical protein
MPAPRVFVSSTFYDLRYIRENLEYFIRSLGYEPVLSERGAVFFDPEVEVQEAAVGAVPSCQMLVLIIGGRFGQQYKPDPEQSVTNAEYKKAVETKVPIFALIERTVHEQYKVYRGNKDNPELDAASIEYPDVDSVKVFDFIEEVQGQAANNALVPFADFGDMESYLRQQWASMMFTFLSSQSEARRVADMVSAVSEVSQKIEFLTTEVVKSVGDKPTRAAAEMYDIVLAHPGVDKLARGNATPTPDAILSNTTAEKYFAAAGIEFVPTEPVPGQTDNVQSRFEISTANDDGNLVKIITSDYTEIMKTYRALRRRLLKIIKEYNLTPADYLKRDVRRRRTAIEG